ncbi:MAG: alpha/beta fold hydrolase [Leptospirales bacterium]|nr:alpha/beta fold hydrolase [Leptospirales bacterium]
MHFLSFQPSRLFRGRHVQTIGANLLARFRGYDPRRRGMINESALTPTLDDSGDCIWLDIHRFVGPADSHKPAALLVHGLEGDSDSVYIISVTERLLRAGFHVIRMNLRSCGRGGHFARRAYNASLTVDLLAAAEYVRRTISPHLAIVGFSLGANLTLKLMGEDRTERERQLRVFGGKARLRRRTPPADVFVAASPPLDLARSCEQLDEPPCRIYRDMFLREIKERARRRLFIDHPDLERELREIRTMFDFDHCFTAPAGGFRSAIDYYKAGSSLNYLSGIEAPGLVLHAEDDPMINMEGWHQADWDRRPHILAELTATGGHLGWIARRHPLLPDKRWMDYRIVEYLSAWRDALR